MRDLQKDQRFKVVSLGCRTNQYEAQALRDQLLALGLKPARENEHADLCIVNTCTVTESADAKSRNEIRKLAKKHPGAKLVVTGCSVERQPEKIGSIEGVTHLVPNANKEILLEEIFPEVAIPEFRIKDFDTHTRAFVKIQDGCNSFCTYCIIPYVRGRSRSRKMEDIIKEVEDLIKAGYKEVVLTGINIGDFDGNPPKGEKPDKLSDLIREMDTLPGIERIRVSSIDPDEVDDDLLDAIISGKHTCHSMHIVLQSGSNVVLKRMNRKYTRQIFMETIGRLRKACPDFTFTTDIIIGFPKETETDFQETMETIEETGFVKVHLFPFSPRPRTRAALYPQLDAAIIRERKQQLMRLSEKVAYRERCKFVGRTMKVLTETGSESGKTLGHTDNFLPVVSEGAPRVSNQIVGVKLVENTPSGLRGEVIQ